MLKVILIGIAFCAALEWNPQTLKAQADERGSGLAILGSAGSVSIPGSLAEDDWNQGWGVEIQAQIRSERRHRALLVLDMKTIEGKMKPNPFVAGNKDFTLFNRGLLFFWCWDLSFDLCGGLGPVLSELSNDGKKNRSNLGEFAYSLRLGDSIGSLLYGLSTSYSRHEGVIDDETYFFEIIPVMAHLGWQF